MSVDAPNNDQVEIKLGSIDKKRNYSEIIFTGTMMMRGLLVCLLGKRSGLGCSELDSGALDLFSLRH